MQNFSIFSSLILLLASIVIMDFSQICLRHQEKHKEKTLVAINPKYTGIKLQYSTKFKIILITFIFTALLSYAIFFIVDKPVNHVSFFVFSPLIFSSVVSALFDGIFALKHSVFPVSNRSSSDRFVVNPQNTLNWIAYCQIGLAIFLAIAMMVLLVI
jgi:hypothetical protein